MPTLDLKGTHHFYTTKFLSIGTSINTMFCKWCDKPQLKLHCIAFYFVSILYLDELGNFFVFVPYNQSVIFDQRILTSLLIQPLYTSTYYVLELLLNPDCLHLIWLTHTSLAENVSENHIILINSSYL